MLTLGGYLKKKENLSARLGDVLSAMYLASMVLKHHENQGRTRRRSAGGRMGLQGIPALQGAGAVAHDFLRNFPNRFLGGRHARTDIPRRPRVLGAQRSTRPHAADAVLNAPTCAIVLCKYVYRTLEAGNRSACCTRPLVLSQTAEPIEKRIRVEGVKSGKVTALDVPGQIAQALSQGIISETEAAGLRDYDRKVMELISVDDFDTHELAAQAQPATDLVGVSDFDRTEGQVA